MEQTRTNYGASQMPEYARRGSAEAADQLGVPMPDTVLNRLDSIHKRATGQVNDLLLIAERVESFADRLIGTRPMSPNGSDQAKDPGSKHSALEETVLVQNAMERQVQRICSALVRLGA